MTTDPAPFVGAKGALFLGASVITIQRDDLPGLRWAGLWDLPGGGREGGETPVECFLRELSEELTLTLSADRLLWAAQLPSVLSPSEPAWLFAARLTKGEVDQIKLGDEGQGWALMPVSAFLDHPEAIPQMQDRVAMAVRALGVIGPEIR